MTTQETGQAEAGRRVLILGGGFAGVYTALGLERELRPADRTQVTLVNRDNYLLFTPFLCEVAASAIDPTHAVNPIRRLLHRTRFIEGEATSLDTERRSVSVRQPDGREQDLVYDHLVIALGARTAFFGMHDVQEHALTATTLGDAIHLRNWIIELLEIAAVEPDAAARTELLTFVVVGGGFTGVEMAGALNALLRQALRAYRDIAARDVRVILVEAQPRLLPQFNERLARAALGALRSRGVEVRLNTRIAGAREHAVHTKDGERLPTRTLVWASGVAPPPFAARFGVPTDEQGWVTVDAHLRVPGLPKVWALGDCAHVPDPRRPGHFQPALAQHAMREAHHLARNLAATLRGAPTTPFRYRTRGQMATFGHYDGVGVIGPISVSGVLAWLAWRSYYLWRLPRLGKRLHVAMDWTADILFGRDISQLQIYRTTSSAPHHAPEALTTMAPPRRQTGTSPLEEGREPASAEEPNSR